MSWGDRCDHGAEGFCMLCCREGEGKGGRSYQDSFCQYGRDPRITSVRDVCYGNGYQHGGFCEQHKAFAGTVEDAVARARTEVVQKIVAASRSATLIAFADWVEHEFKEERRRR